ncbi:MAG: arsenic resistance N-acetyltransferase ArsN2 [Gemmatimonadota bacterium]|nr:arsenic resistance N-acetyltransferase ArsN2 [Gemmatimonadota bacterium]
MSGDTAADRRCVAVRSAMGEDLPGIQALLQRSGLPIAGVEEWLPHFLLAEHEGRMVAVAGLELHGASALLRSVAVEPDWRGSGLARQLIDRQLSEAHERHIKDVYLLTTTAEHYFPRLGFACIGRSDVPAQVHESVEFREACPASAVVMRKTLAER